MSIMSWKRASLILCLSISCFSFADVSEEEAARRVQDHLLIEDFHEAASRAKEYLSLYPESRKLHFLYVKSLCEKGEEKEAYQEVLQTIKLSPEEENHRFIYETLAWGVLNKGEDSPLLMIKLYSLLGAAYTRDAKALPLLLEQMQSSNALLRSVAVKIAASYGDTPVQEELVKLLHTEKVWYVKLDVLHAIGQLRIKAARACLKEMIANPKTLAEEKAAAIIALVSMYDGVEDTELQTLVSSNRAGLRQLASELIIHLDLQDKTEYLLPLLQDTHPSVRVSALNAIGLMQVKTIGKKPVLASLERLCRDPCPEVAVTAGWAATVLGFPVGQETLKAWMQQPLPEWRRLASAALSVSGSFSVKMVKGLLQKETDPYVKANLALGLIGQRQNVKESAKVLFHVLVESGNDLWMWDNRYNPLFRTLAPSEVKHVEQIPRYPQVIDQLVKLELLSALSVVQYPQALEAVKEFLRNQSWGITGAAAATLLEEGDEQALQLIRELLTDPEEKIRIQAALILALVGSDVSAIKVLQETYPYVDREMKMVILEALGHIGDLTSVPFLMGVLDDPFQVLRIVAASALIQCIYH